MNMDGVLMSLSPTTLPYDTIYGLASLNFPMHLS
jgi:hypothetical protein